jgi:hypothetical protein
MHADDHVVFMVGEDDLKEIFIRTIMDKTNMKSCVTKMKTLSFKRNEFTACLTKLYNKETE